MVVMSAAAIIIMLVVVIVMLMPMFRLRVSATFRIKSGFDQGDFSTKPAHHIFDHMIAADADAIIKNLHRQMAVAEMPRHVGELARAGAANFRQRLRLAEYFDQAAIIKHDGVARAQHDGLWQIEQKF